MGEDKKSVVDSRSVEQEIDLIELAQKVWLERKLILKVCGIAVLVALVVYCLVLASCWQAAAKPAGCTAR